MSVPKSISCLYFLHEITLDQIEICLGCHLEKVGLHLSNVVLFCSTCPPAKCNNIWEAPETAVDMDDISLCQLLNRLKSNLLQTCLQKACNKRLVCSEGFKRFPLILSSTEKKPTKAKQQRKEWSHQKLHSFRIKRSLFIIRYNPQKSLLKEQYRVLSSGFRDESCKCRKL